MVSADDLERRGASRLTVDVEDVTITIETLDRAPRDGEIPSLALRISFEPQVIAYTFDPSHVVLRFPGDEPRRARNIDAEPEPLLPGSTYSFVFDTPLRQEAEAEVEIGGLARGARTLDAFVLRLRRESDTSIERMYWLEAIGYVVGGILGLAQYTMPTG
jgi:hypothetical protein